MTMAEAIQALGVSRSTIERRIKKGTLTGYKERSRWIVDVPTDVSVDETDTSRDVSDEVTRLMQRVTDLTRQLDEMREDRDRWRDEAERSTLVSAQATAAANRLTERLALPDPAKRRSWWQRLSGWIDPTADVDEGQGE